MGKQFKNAAIIGCMKTFLFAFNIVLWLSGLLLLAVGCVAEYDMYRYAHRLELSPELSGTAPLVVISIAALTIVVSSIAFAFIVRGQPVLLYVYAAYLVCISAVDLGLGAAVACYRDSFGKALQDGMSLAISAPDSGQSHFSFLQPTLHCCGISNYTDWLRLSPQRVIPASCCQDPAGCVTANYGELYHRGCYEVIVEYLVQNLNPLIGVAVGIAALPVFGSILSCLLATYIKRVRSISLEAQVN